MFFRYILIFTFVHMFTDGFSQQIRFQHTYGTSTYEWGECKPTTDGGYIVAATIDSFPQITTPNSRAFLIKTDSIGNVLWNKTYTKPGYTSDAARIIQTSDSGYLFRLSLYKNSLFNHACLIRTDANGDTLWTKCPLSGNHFIETTDTGYAVFSGGSLTKLDANGNIVWKKLYPGFNGPSMGQQTTDKGYILYGSTNPFTVSGDTLDFDLYLIKTDSVGNMQWNKVFGSSSGLEGISSGFGRAIQQTIDGGYIMAANTDGFGYGLKDILVIKTDSNGNMQWTKTYGGTSSDEATSIREVVGAVGYVLTGITFGVETPQNSWRTLLIRIDGSGNLMWSRMYGGMAANSFNSYDEAYYVDNAKDGGFIFSGATQSFGSGYYDVWLVKTDANGISGCNEIPENVYITIPPLLIGAGGNDSTLPVTQPGDSIVYITQLQIGDSLLCSSAWPVGDYEYTAPNQNILLFPNPSSGILIIQTKGEIKNIEVINVLGEKVYWVHDALLLNHTSTIDLSSQPDGIYFLRLQTEKGVGNKKLVVMR